MVNLLPVITVYALRLRYIKAIDDSKTIYNYVSDMSYVPITRGALKS